MSKNTPSDCNCLAARQAARRITQFYDRFLAPVALRTTQFSILTRLDQSGPMSIHALAEAIVMDRTTLGRNILPLEREGLIAIAQSDKDKRSKELTLTAGGHEKLSRAVDGWLEAQSQFEKAFGAKRASDLRAILHDVAAADLWGRLGDLCAGRWTRVGIYDSIGLNNGLRNAMARRRIGQERFGFATDRDQRSSLDDLVKLIDWTPIDCALRVISCAAKGEPAWPPLSLFKAMLLSIWYDLSDVKLAEALDDRGSFRRFCGFSVSEPTPERTAFVRFRKALVGHGLDRILFEEITRQLKAKAIRVKTGTLVDATIIASTSEGDGEAHWVKHKGRPAVHGFKAHVGADADTALVEELAVTPANVNDGRAGPDALPANPGEVFADSAYRGSHFAAAVRAKGGTPRIVATGMWGRDEAETSARLHAWNRPIHRIRGRIEKIFGTWKRSYGLRRMRWRGLAKAAVQIHFTAIAYNMKRTLTIAAKA